MPHLTVMVGYPWESKADIQKTICFVERLFKENLVDSMQATLIIPYPGTSLFKYCQKKKLLKTKNWDRYDMTEVIHRSASIDSSALADEMDMLNRRIYAWPVLVRKAFRTFRRTRDVTTTMFAWNSNINYRNVGEMKRRSCGNI